MNKFAILCVLATCLVVSHAFVRRTYPSYPGKKPIITIRYCYNGNYRVSPGSFYFDGCNTCMCGIYGQATRCTTNYCPPAKPVKTIYPKRTIKPVYPKRPVFPKRPVYPVAY